MKLLFEHDEYRSRVARVKDAMRAQGIDLLLISNPANQFYVTGYDGWSFYTPQMVVVAIDADEPIWFGRKMDAVGAKFTAFLAEENVIAYPDKYVGSDTLHPMDYLVKILRDKGWHKGRVAAEQDDYYYTAKWNRILTQALGQGEFEDAFLLVNKVRMKKSEQEIEYMSQAGQIATLAMDSARKLVRPGVRQCDVMARNLPRDHFRYTGIWWHVPLQTAQCHGRRNCGCSSFELDRPAVGRGRDLLHRNGGRSTPLSLPPFALRFMSVRPPKIWCIRRP